MASRSAPAVLVLGFLVVAAFCMAEASATKSKAINPLEADVKITLKNECKEDARLVVALSKLLDCKKGRTEVLGPVAVELEALKLLKLQLELFGKNGKLLKVKAAVNVNLGVLGEVIDGVTELVLELVEVAVKGAKYKLIKLLSGTEVLVTLKVNLDQL